MKEHQEEETTGKLVKIGKSEDDPIIEKRFTYYLGYGALGLIFAVVAIIAYWPILNNTLVADDYVFVIPFQNCPDCELTKLFTILSDFAVRPLTMFVFLVQSRLFGLDPLPSHLINVSFHAGTAVVLFWFLNQAGAKRITAFISALLFLLTPIAPEAVTWSSGRADVLALFFILLTVSLYKIALTRHNRTAFVFSMIAAAAALLSKEEAYMLIIMLPAMEFIYGVKISKNKEEMEREDSRIRSIIRRFLMDIYSRLSDREFLSRQIIFISITCGVILLHFAILGRMGGYSDTPLLAFPHFGSARATFRTLVAPLNEAEFSWETIRIFGFYTATVLLIGVAVTIIRWRKTTLVTRRLMITMVIFFIASMLPVFSMLFLTGIYNNLQDSRFLYVPTMSFLAILVIALLEFGWQKRGWKMVAIFLLGILLSAYAVGLRINNQPWQRSAAINQSINEQVLELLPSPPNGATLIFTHLPVWDKSYIITGALPKRISLLYGRDDLTVVRIRDPKLETSETSEGFLFDYDSESGLLQLVKQP